MHKFPSFFLGILSGILVSLTGCTVQEDNSFSTEIDRYLRHFSMGIEPVGTRASIDFSSGAITWNDNDRVLVYVPETGLSAEYKYDGGVFVPADTEPLEIGDAQAFAYYPAEAFSLDGGAVTLTMPASVTEDPGHKLPMGGIIPAGQMAAGKPRREGTFKSLGSILWLKLTAVEGKEGTVTRVRIANSSLALTGEAPVSWNEDTPVLGTLNGEKTIDVVCSKTLTTSVPAEFYLFVPAGDQQELSLELTLEEVAGYKSSVHYARTGTLTLARNKVLPISFDVNGKVPKGIATADEFKAFAAAVNAGESTAEWENAEGWVNLLNDIDFEGVTDFVPAGFATAPWNSSMEPVFAEGEGHSFTGKFDGNAFHIKNLHLVCKETVAGRHYGLFGSLGPGAVVQNFVIEDNCSLTVSSSVSLSAGMIAGLVYDAEVRDVTSYAPLSYTNTANTAGNANAIHVAGIVGFTNAPTNDAKPNTISSCNNYGDITSQAGRTAGILGAANRCTQMIDCENHGDQLNTMPTTSAGRLGGVVCFITNNSGMSGCKNYGNITSTTNACVGGIMCLPNAGTYRNLENYGEVVTDNANRGVFFGYVNQAAVFDGGFGQAAEFQRFRLQYDHHYHRHRRYAGRRPLLRRGGRPADLLHWQQFHQGCRGAPPWHPACGGNHGCPDGPYVLWRKDDPGVQQRLRIRHGLSLLCVQPRGNDLDGCVRQEPGSRRQERRLGCHHHPGTHRKTACLGLDQRRENGHRRASGQTQGRPDGTWRLSEVLLYPFPGLSRPFQGAERLQAVHGYRSPPEPCCRTCGPAGPTTIWALPGTATIWIWALPAMAPLARCSKASSGPTITMKNWMKTPTIPMWVQR